jgi:hypothetical protein
MIPSFDQIIKSIERLPAAEQGKIRQWLEYMGATNGEGHDSQAHVNRSAKSLRWLHENREKYPGQWVALDGDYSIASGLTAKEVYCKAKAEGVDIPFVELVANREPVPFTGGWLS